MSSSRLLRRYIYEILQPLVSHSAEPAIGSVIINTNPKCKHYKSGGTVLAIDSLDGDMGKVVTYLVSNNGENFVSGDVLTKTLDQIEVVE